jgi:cell division septum initiation protein DivIVA
MADKKIRLLVQAEVKKAVQALNKVEKEQKDIKKQNDGLKKSFAGLGGAIAGVFAVGVLTNYAKESLRLKGQTDQLTKAFKNLGNQVGFNEQSLEKFRKATNGTVSDVDLMTQANNALLLGIVESDDQFADLIDSAQRLAQAVGQDAVFGIESLTTGIGRQSKLMLDNLGIIVDTNRAYEIYAERLGKSTSELTDNERKQAFIQATMESVRSKVDQLGEETLGATEAMAELEVSMENLQLAFGGFVEGPGLVFINFLSDGISGLTNISEDISGVIQHIKGFPDRLQESFDSIGQEQKIKIAFDTFVGPMQPSEFAPDNVSPSQALIPDEDEFLPDMKVVEETYDEIDRIIRKHEEGRKKNIEFIRKLEADAHKERIAQNLQAAILSGQSAKEAATSVVKAEIAEAQAGLISSIMTSVPFPFNLVLAAGAGAMIGKVTDQLLSFQTGGSFVTKGRTTLPLGNGVVVGDNASGMERIDVTPLPSPTSNGNNITINISAPLVDETVVETIIPAIRRAEKLNL